MVDRILGRAGRDGAEPAADRKAPPETETDPTAAVWTTVQLARNLRRPRTLELVGHIADEFVELHGDRLFGDDPAMVGGLAHSGRVILAAGAVMVAVFFTFALSGPLPPKEMGAILGIAVLLDAFLVRLLLLPVFLRLAGRAAWYLPAWLDRILPDVHFGHGPT